MNLPKLLKSSPILQTIIILVSFAMLLILSELLFFYNRRPGNFAFPYLMAADRSISRGDLNNTLIMLNRAAYWHIKENKINYGTQFSAVNTTYTINDSKISEDLMLYLKDHSPDPVNSNHPYLLSNLYYHMALISYEDNNPALAQTFLKMSAYLDPTLSYPFVESASLYLEQNQLNYARDILNECTAVRSSAYEHCKSYIDKDLEKDPIEKFGSFREAIDLYQLKYEAQKSR